MPVESTVLWAEWNATFDGLKVAHEKLRRLAYSPEDDQERRDAPDLLFPERCVPAPAIIDVSSWPAELRGAVIPVPGGGECGARVRPALPKHP